MTIEQERYHQWVEALQFFPDYAEELDAIKDNAEEIQDRFYQYLTFGTAGLRGIIGMGTNRMNPFTVGRATQGLADYWLAKKDKPSVAIGFDSRNCSTLFAEHTATIFAANGFKVHLFPQLAPTPALAFALQALHCDCGVMITASHNPAEYNGYKVFNANGCQIDNEVANDVLKYIDQVQMFGVGGVKKINLRDGLADGSISYISEELSTAFCDAAMKQALQPEICKKADLNVVYTPLNGTGNLYVREVLKRLNIEKVAIVPEQELPDGNFPTCPYPNPEFPEALELGLKLSKEKDADFLLATDPDADRVAIAVKHKGMYERINGNLLGVLLLDYIGKTRKKLGTLPENPVAVRSIVSTKLFDKVGASYGIATKSVLTGFKYIGDVISQLEEQSQSERFVLGFEEACGYLIGTHVQDKDAVVTSVLVCEMIAALKLEGKTALDRLEEIYQEHGYFLNTTQNLVFPGAEGMEQMAGIMSQLRQNPPTKIVGRKILSYLDYQTGKQQTGDTVTAIDTPPSNVLEYHLEDGCSLIIRPSGTEPKLKIYYSLVGANMEMVEKLKKEYAQASVELAGVEA